MHKQLLLLFILAGLLISCNGNQEGTKGTTNGGKKIFRMNQTEELTSTDPAFANNQANIWMMSQLYSGLFEFTEDLHEHPALAETWNISEDGLVYTINIRKDRKIAFNERLGPFVHVWVETLVFIHHLDDW